MNRPYAISRFESWRTKGVRLGIRPGTNALSKLAVSIEITAEDVRGLAESVGRAVDATIPQVARQLGGSFTQAIHRAAQQNVAASQAQVEYVRLRLRGQWSKAFDWLCALIGIAEDLHEVVRETYHAAPVAKRTHMLEAQLQVHARACHTTWEILTLLEFGHPDGALARWRTIHEIACVSSFLLEKGEVCAERYLRHEDVDALRAAKAFNKAAILSKGRKVSPTEMAFLERRVTRLAKRFGEPYRSEYGWASDALGIKSPRFSDVEAAVGLGHARQSYRLASGAIHAGPQTTMYKVGMLAGVEYLMLAGTSSIELDEVGIFAAHALAASTVNLLLARVTLDSLVWSNVVLATRNRVTRQFSRIRRQIDRAAKDLQT
jgi:hypothetical protein